MTHSLAHSRALRNSSSSLSLSFHTTSNERRKTLVAAWLRWLLHAALFTKQRHYTLLFTLLHNTSHTTLHSLTTTPPPPLRTTPHRINIALCVLATLRYGTAVIGSAPCRGGGEFGYFNYFVCLFLREASYEWSAAAATTTTSSSSENVKWRSANWTPTSPSLSLSHTRLLSQHNVDPHKEITGWPPPTDRRPNTRFNRPTDRFNIGSTHPFALLSQIIIYSLSFMLTHTHSHAYIHRYTLSVAPTSTVRTPS